MDGDSMLQYINVLLSDLVYSQIDKMLQAVLHGHGMLLMHWLFFCNNRLDDEQSAPKRDRISGLILYG